MCIWCGRCGREYDSHAAWISHPCNVRAHLVDRSDPTKTACGRDASGVKTTGVLAADCAECRERTGLVELERELELG